MSDVFSSRLPILLLASSLLAVAPVQAQTSDPAALNALRTAVKAELAAARNDHTAWDYRDHDVQPGKDDIYRVIETPHGDLKRLLQANGRPLTGQAEQQELERIRQYVNSPAEQEKERKASAHDDAQARELLTMLPDAFIWNTVSENAQQITLRFKPNPAFHPPDMQSRVLAVMAGEMVIARNGDRIELLKGTLTDDVKFGFGIFGKIDQGRNLLRPAARGFARTLADHGHPRPHRRPRAALQDHRPARG